MNAIDLLLSEFRDHVEATAAGTLAGASFVLRDQDDARSFPQIIFAERGMQLVNDAVLGVHRAQVDVTLRTIPAETDEDAHRVLGEELWDIVADDTLADSLSVAAGLTVHQVLPDGSTSTPDDGLQTTAFQLLVVFYGG